jgi:hypothetical protein
LERLANNKRNQSGFMARICFLYSKEAQATPLSLAEFGTNFLEQWNKIISDIISLYRNESITTYTLNNETRTIFQQWNIEKTNRINRTDDESLRTIYSKSEMWLLRLALILEILNRVCWEVEGKDTFISAKAMNGAIKLTEYFIETSIRVHEIATNSNPLAKYPIKIQDFIKALPDMFETKTALLIGSRFNIQERTVKKHLKDKSLFKRIEHGQYEKI